MITKQSSFEELELSVRAYNGLYKLAEESGLFVWEDHSFVKKRDLTVGDIIGTDEDILFRLRNFGKRSLDELKKELGRHGFQLAARRRGVKPRLDCPPVDDVKPEVSDSSPVGPTHANLTCGFCGFSFIVPIEEAKAGEPDCPRCLDAFAKAALTGILFSPGNEGDILQDAQAAYRYAIAMNDVRQKRPAAAFGDRFGASGTIIERAIALAVQHGGHDGAHHKDWVIDQMVRILAGSAYAKVVTDACAGEDGPNTYEWKVGIAP